MKKILGVFLSASLMLTMSSATVYAQEDMTVMEDMVVSEENTNEVSAEEKEVTYEAQIGEISYPTLKEALLAGGEVKLLKDVSVDEIIEITKDTTLDLGDFTITDNAPKRPFVVKTENFTIKANKGGMVIPESNTQAYGFVEAYVQNFSILGGNYQGNSDNGRFFRINAPDSKTGTINVDGIVANTNNEIIGHNDTFTSYSGSIKNSEFYTDTRAMYFDIMDTTEASTITIDNIKAVVARGPVIEVAGGNTILSNNDWTVTGNYEGGDSWARAAVGVGYGANVTIKSGKYYANSESMKENEGYGVYIYTSGGTVNIEGGSFAGTTAALRADVDTYYNHPAKIVVNNGEFLGDLLAKTNTGMESIVVNGGNFNGLTDATIHEKNNVQVAGGVFDLDVTDKVVEGKEAIAVTKNNDTNYYIGEEKVKEAFDHVTEGDKVTIIQNVTEVEVPDGVTVENSTGNDIIVNGEIVKDNQTVITDHAPTATVTYSNEGSWTNQDVTVTIKANEAIKDVEGWTKVDEQTLTKVFTDNALVTVMITDLAGKTSKVEVDVKNIDKQSPEIRGLSDITLVQGETFDPLKGISAYDEQCGEIEDIEVTPAIDTNVPGIYELTYTVSDLAGNITTVKRTVTVNPKEAIVNHAPIIKAEDVTLTVGDNYDPLKGVTASDKEDGDLTKSIEVTENTVDTAKAGTYQVTYRVRDRQGASAVKVIKVTVKDKEVVLTPETPNHNTSGSNKGSVETGDHTNTGFYASLFAVSILGLVVLTAGKKKVHK